jgi:hypothetical protein
MSTSFETFLKVFFAMILGRRVFLSPHALAPRVCLFSRGPSFLLRLSLVVCSLLVSRKEKMMWHRFKASFRSGAHMRDYLLAVAASVLLAFCVGALLFAWIVL